MIQLAIAALGTMPTQLAVETMTPVNSLQLICAVAAVVASLSYLILSGTLTWTTLKLISTSQILMLNIVPFMRIWERSSMTG